MVKVSDYSHFGITTRKLKTSNDVEKAPCVLELPYIFEIISQKDWY